MDIIKQVQHCQVDVGLNDRELAALLGISKAYWSLIKSGQRQMTERVKQALREKFPDLVFSE